MSISSPSGLDGWDKSRFEAFTKLLLLKSGRQVEEASDFINIPSEETESSDLKSIDSVKVVKLSQFNEDKLQFVFQLALDKRIQEIHVHDCSPDLYNSSLKVIRQFMQSFERSENMPRPIMYYTHVINNRLEI
jgi:hypothetical protein